MVSSQLHQTVTDMNKALSYNPACAISEADAFTASQEDAITKLRIVRQGSDMMLFLHLSWRKGEMYVATKRNKAEPRRFKNADRFFEYLEANFPTLYKLPVSIAFLPVPSPNQ